MKQTELMVSNAAVVMSWNNSQSIVPVSINAVLWRWEHRAELSQSTQLSAGEGCCSQPSEQLSAPTTSTSPLMYKQHNQLQ